MSRDYSLLHCRRVGDVAPQPVSPIRRDVRDGAVDLRRRRERGIVAMFSDSRRQPEPIDGHGPELRLALADRPSGGSIDGAWWPYSRDLGVELPPLLAGLRRASGLGGASWVSAGRSGWDRSPMRIRIDGVWVRMRLLGMLDGQLLTVNFLDGDRIRLLVVPTDAPDDTAAAALAAGATGRMAIDRQRD
ncbi:DUF5994 family protein [Actinocatenispora sera]|uniref:DUF5994 family protein n=1 Tax=Actinocatenispora sera TaxID=390989 RepID=UPI0012ED2CFC|nr:DUF5994 family protein [Actinocatenispora sera]